VDPVADLLEVLRPLGSPDRAASERAYLKHDLVHLGVGVPALRRAVKAWLPKDLDLRSFAEACWATDVHELRSAAVIGLVARRRRLGVDDLAWLIPIVRKSTTWAHTDELAVHVIGPVVAAAPDEAAILRRWASDPAMWVRRTAILAPLLRIRAGTADLTGFDAIAVPLLPERDFFVRKAIGWVLREACRHHPEQVAAFVAAHRDRMSGVTLREAVRKLPAELRPAP
jgi:3-methyladenine DNA glycosylase AlkD